MVILRISKWWERSRLNIGGGDSEEWLEGGGDEGGDLFLSGFSLFSSSFQSVSFHSAWFHSRFFTKFFHPFSLKAIWAQLLKVPARSTFEMLFSISLMKEYFTVIFGLPKGLWFVWNAEIYLAGTHLQGIRIIIPINMSLLFEMIFPSSHLILSMRLRHLI